MRRAVELGLVNGRGGGIYDPAGNVTVAETIKLAVAAYQSFFEEARLENGRERWYDTYVAYAKEKAIISRDYDYTAVATRAQMAEILAGLPDDILYEMCFVEDDAIPDVAIGSAYGPAVYRLYRAGIMGGSDNKGTYFPDRTLSRSEMAAIVVRLASYDQRVYNVLLKGNTGAGNTANNWANRGYFAQAGDWIYYRNYNDSGFLYKMKLDGSENTLLVAESVHGINIINGTILYFHEDTGTDARSYCKILEPGETEPQVLYSIEYDYDDQDDYNTDRFMCIGEDVYMSMLAASGRDGYGWAGYSLYRNNWDNSDGIDLIN